MAPAPLSHGLDGVVAVHTRLSHVDGQNGLLLIALSREMAPLRALLSITMAIVREAAKRRAPQSEYIGARRSESPA